LATPSILLEEAGFEPAKLLLFLSKREVKKGSLNYFGVLERGQFFGRVLDWYI
jgi:hypothetical protein